MDDLITWLRGQIDLDERTALAVQDNSAPFTGQWKVPCRTLRLLAAGYDTEPGYQEAWR